MTATILTLSDPNATLENTGGKGMSLAKMINGGLPVPGGFHITTQAYRQFVTENGIKASIQEALLKADPFVPDTCEIASQAIEKLFTEGQVPAEITQSVSAAYQALAQFSSETLNPAVAVRSSATAEDLPDASFAGQQETYLNIRGSEEVLKAAKKCWASLWTARAIAYRLKNNIDQETVALAVVVQEMVFAEAAGILFTANPINGRRDEILINAAWGLGEAVVSGAVTPDTLTVAKKTGKTIRREIAEKLVMTVQTETGTIEAPVPADRQKTAVLSKQHAKELALLGAKIETFYGMPMDIEWAYAGGKFAILQARPITALPPEWKSPYPGAIYARGSLAEHTPNPVTPLFATFGLELANEATKALWARVFNKDSIKILPPNGFYTPINGYVFGGMYMKGKDLFTVIKLSFAQMKPFFNASVERWQEYHEKLAVVVADWEQKEVETLSPSELLEGAQILFGAACRYFTNIQTTLPAASMSEVIFTRFYNSLVKRKGGSEVTVFLLGSETVALRSEKSLYDLALWLKTSPGLATYVLETPTETLAGNLSGETPPAGLPTNEWTEWCSRFESHLREFGRTAYEFDFANPTPLETPGPMLEAVKGFLSGKAANPYERQSASLQKREQATQAAERRLIWPLKGWFTRLLHWTQETSPMRENAIFDMGMGHPLIRSMLNELGERFAAGSALENPEDIYWLEKNELETLVTELETGKSLTNFSALVPQRKTQWQGYLKLSPPIMIPERSGLAKLMHGGEALKKDGKIILKGVGTSSGKVTAPACVLFSPEDFNKMKPGDVLVAVTTTPAWTPLFSLASAVVTDIGGPLSHSSIVAREYGIPAVMAARGATHHIRNGQTITVDGAKGIVVLED
ncbi:MAG: pyruvate, phosphate dikinase [Chloroflexi bacterium HGW-Chloroflexi-10]|nr:MAG: pyruvate, phosphate dikinase [Chloroflexi bacterium HGW-Chloroflexi-10]